MSISQLRRPISRTLAAALLAVSSAASVQPLRAATYFWLGTSDNSWSTNANWQGGMAPPTSDLVNTDLIFTNSGGSFPSINAPYSIRSLTFTANANAFIFDTGPLTLGAGGFTQNAANSEAFGAPVVLGANQTWALASGAGALTFSNGVNTTSGGNNYALTVNAATATGGGNVINGAITGGGSLTKTGAGTLTLNGSATPTGGTIVDAGTLVLNNGASSTVTVNNAATLQVQANNSVSGVTGPTVDTYSGIAGGVAVTLSNGGTLTNAGAITGGKGGNTSNGVGGAGGAAVTLNGSGTLTNTGTITGGNGGGGTNGASNGSRGNGGGGGAAMILNGGGTLTNTGTITGGNGGGGGSNRGNGGGGGAAATLSNGGTLTNSGTLTGGNGGNGGNGASNGGNGSGVTSGGAATSLINANGGTILGGVALGNFANGVTLQIGSTISGGLNVGTSSAATLTLSDNGTGGSQTYSGAVGGSTIFSGALTKAGVGTWTLDQALGYTGGTTLAGGVLRLTDAGALGTSGAISFVGGTLQYSATNTTDYSARFSTAPNQAYRVDTNGQNVTFAAGLSSGGGSLTKLGAGTLTLAGTNTYTGNTVVNAGRLVLNGGSIASGLLRANVGTEIDYNGVAVGGNLSGSGTQAVGIGGATFSSPAANVLTIFNGVNLSIGGPTTFNQVNNSGAVTVAIAQTLTWNDGQNDQGTLTVNGTAKVSGWTSTGILAVNSGGVVANSATNLVLGGGSRTTIIAGGQLSTAAGTSIELNGALLVNNGTQTGTLNVNYGSTAKGTGRFGNVAVSDGGRFGVSASTTASSVGSGLAVFHLTGSGGLASTTFVGPQLAVTPGKAYATSLALGSGGVFAFNVQDAANTNGNGYDTVSLSGALTLAAGTMAGNQITITVTSLAADGTAGQAGNFDPAKNYAFTLVSALGGVAGYNAQEFLVNASGFQNATNGGSFSVVQSGNDLLLTYTSAVPEPSTWALCGLGVGLLGLSIHRRSIRRH